MEGWPGPHPERLGWAEVKKQRREKENRERKESNHPSHLWKPLLLPRVTGRTKATTPFSPTFRSRELKKRGWWLL